MLSLGCLKVLVPGTDLCLCHSLSLEAVSPSATELSHKITRIQAALALSALKPTSQPVKAVRPATEKGAVQYSVLANLA